MEAGEAREKPLSVVTVHEKRKDLVKQWLQKWSAKDAPGQLCRAIVCDVPPSVYDLEDTIAKRLRCSCFERFPQLVFTTHLGYVFFLLFLVCMVLMTYSFHSTDREIAFGSSIFMMVLSIFIRAQASSKLVWLSLKRFDIQFLIANCVVLCFLIAYFFSFHPSYVVWSISMSIVLFIVTMTDALPPGQRRVIIQSTLWAAIVFLLFIFLEIYMVQEVVRERNAEVLGKKFFVVDRCVSAVLNVLWYFSLIVFRTILGKQSLYNPSYPLVAHRLDPRVCHVLGEIKNVLVLKSKEGSGHRKRKVNPTSTQLEPKSHGRKLRLVFSTHNPVKIVARNTVSYALFGTTFSQICFLTLKKLGAVLTVTWAVGMLCALTSLNLNTFEMGFHVRVAFAVGACISLAGFFFQTMLYNVDLLRLQFSCPESLYHTCNNVMLSIALLVLSADHLATISIIILSISSIASGLYDCSTQRTNESKRAATTQMLGSLLYATLFLQLLRGNLDIDYEKSISFLSFEMSPVSVLYSVLLNLVVYYSHFAWIKYFYPFRLMSMEAEVGTARVSPEEAVIYSGFTISQIERILDELDKACTLRPTSELKQSQ